MNEEDDDGGALNEMGEADVVAGEAAAVVVAAGGGESNLCASLRLTSSASGRFNLLTNALEREFKKVLASAALKEEASIVFANDSHAFLIGMQAKLASIAGSINCAKGRPESSCCCFFSEVVSEEFQSQ